MKYNFVEVVKNFDRLCNTYNHHCRAEECPISALLDLWEKATEDSYDDHCLEFAKVWPDRFAEEVMKWAANHEEPIYPTIGEVLNKICILMNINPKTNINTIYDERLDKTTAKYFGIEPINKDKLV